MIFATPVFPEILFTSLLASAELERQDGVVTEFDENLWYSLVDFVKVFNKEDVRFTFKDGTEIKV